MRPPGDAAGGPVLPTERTSDERPELASPLLDLRERPPQPLAPSPQALGVWELAWPTILAGAMQTLVRWADFIMVGDLGVEAVAGVGAGGQVFWFIQSPIMAATTGLVALVARATGARDAALADAVLRQSISLGSLFAIASALLFVPLARPSIAIYGVEPGVVDHGSVYVLALLLGTLPLTLVFVFASALRAAGDARSPLYIGLLANALNVFLNWVLIYGNLGAPALGVVGAGLASSLAMFFQVAVFWVFWRSGRSCLRRFAQSYWPDLALWRRILHIGYPATLEGMLWHLGLFLFLRVMSGYGTAEFTAYQIGAQILALSFLPGTGFSMAASTLVGQHLGDGSPERAARSGWRSLLGSIVTMTALGAALIAFAPWIARLFVDDERVVQRTVEFIWILGVAHPLMAVEFTLGGALRGAGDTRFPLVAVFVGLLLCRVVAASVAAHVFAASIQLVWSALILDYGIKAVMLCERFRRGRWKTIAV